MADWFAGPAELFDTQWRDPTPDLWLDRIEPEHHNLRASAYRVRQIMATLS